MGTILRGWQRRTWQKGSDGGGKTKVGKSSEVIVVTAEKGLPIGLHVDSAQPHESTLAEVTLQIIRVSRKRGCPNTLLRALVANNAYDRTEPRRTLCQRGIKPTITTFERCPRKRPKCYRPPTLVPPIASAVKSNAVLVEWITVAAL